MVNQPLQRPMRSDVTVQFYIDWDNDGTVASGAFENYENVTSKVLGISTPIRWDFGRDTARSLSKIKAGEVTIELKNYDKLYSPDNASSPLVGNLGPGKPVLIRAIHKNVTYNLFWGYIDDFEINPFQDTQSVTLTCTDALGKFGENLATTILYESIQTGDAVGKVLDAVGWSGSKRSIDAGATTIRWFWVDGEPALDAINDIVASEGGSSIAFIDASGNFCFRDRHHRSMDANAITSQVTLNSDGDLSFCEPAAYNVGFRDLCNDVVFSVEERDPQPLEVIWSDESRFRISASSSVTFTVKTEDPFFGAVTPVAVTDYVVESGSVSSVTLSRVSGASTLITVTAGGSTTIVQGLQLRAYPVTVSRLYTITSSDSTSQGKYGLKSWTEDVPKWVGKNDAKALADYIVARRKDRLPVFEVTVNSGHDSRIIQQMTRDISDRIHIVESNTASNHDYYIEQIGYEINDVGEDIRVKFGCERAAEVDVNSTIFILDSAVLNHRLDSGLLAT
jgi:hypothetical protein